MNGLWVKILALKVSFANHNWLSETSLFIVCDGKLEGIFFKRFSCQSQNFDILICVCVSLIPGHHLIFFWNFSCLMGQGQYKNLWNIFLISFNLQDVYTRQYVFMLEESHHFELSKDSFWADQALENVWQFFEGNALAIARIGHRPNNAECTVTNWPIWLVVAITGSWACK